MKKLIIGLCFLWLLAPAFTLAQTAESATPDNTDATTNEPLIGEVSDVFGSGEGRIWDQDTGLQDYSGIDDYSRISGGNDDPDLKGAYQVRNIVSVIIQFLERMMVPIAIVFLFWSALNLLIERGNEEQFSKRVRQIVWTGAGFMLFAFAFTMVDFMFFGVQGNILEGNIERFGGVARAEVLGLVNFVSSFIVAVGVFYLVFGAIQLILLGEQEEQTGKMRRQIIFSIIGILLVASANIIANIFFSGNPGGDQNLSVNSPLLIAQVVYWTNTVLSFVALGAVVAIIWAGVQLVLHFGNEEAVNRSKKIITYAIIGLVLAFSAFTIVRFFLTPGVYSDNNSSPASQLQPFDRVAPTPAP